MEVSIRPTTYQKVKADLHLYTAGLLIVVSFLLYSFVLPEGQRRVFASLFGIISPNDFAGGTLFTLIVVGISFTAIFLFEVHDKVYDKHIVRWRYYYDLDYIIPTLVRPYSDKVDTRFFEYAKSNKYDFMKQLFYPFVADGPGEYRIEENYRVRFYEGVLKYWITQINELVMFLLVAFLFAYFIVYSCLDLQLEPIVVALFILILGFVINRIFVKLVRGSLQQLTLDEIEEIHRKYPTSLEDRLRELHTQFGLVYGNPNQT